MKTAIQVISATLLAIILLITFPKTGDYMDRKEELENLTKYAAKYRADRVEGYTKLAQAFAAALLRSNPDQSDTYIAARAFSLTGKFIDEAIHAHTSWPDRIPLPTQVATRIEELMELKDTPEEPRLPLDEPEPIDTL